MDFGMRIKRRREKLGISQSELARRVGIPPSKVSDWERGSRRDMNLSTALRVARALGCGIDHLAGTWDDDEDPAPVEASAEAPKERAGVGR
jgi:transcriptional regulator with XRE-family HTH domain